LKAQMTRCLTVILSVSIAIFLLGCELEFPNLNAPVVENVPVQSLVTGTEAGMRVDFAIYLRVVASIGREVYYFEPADPRYTGEVLRGTIDPGGFLLNRPWGARYRVAANCNILLDKAASLSGAERAGIEGFAKTLMAYQLLLNLNYMDDNGIQLDFSGNKGTPFASKAASFARIEQLLDEANTSLAGAGSSFSFALSSGFAGSGGEVFNTPAGFAKLNRALRARVAMYQGKFNEALTALQGSFLSTTAPMDLGVYHVYGTGLGDQLNEIFEAPTAPFVKLMAHPSFETDAELGDDRFASKVAVRASATTFDNLTSRLAVTTTSSSTDRLPIIRNEELLLLRAEANIGLGNLGTAQNDINTVRAAAGLGLAVLTPSNALDRLLYEKRYSLFMEGHRWVDMRRYNRLGQLPIDRSGDVVSSRLAKPETE
ncbi:MAG: RagB/SusD family nutrient uptake outer membrane protein, partial [Bacteroidota bacterium]